MSIGDLGLELYYVTENVLRPSYVMDPKERPRNLTIPGPCECEEGDLNPHGC
jgi:hypothetical protein